MDKETIILQIKEHFRKQDEITFAFIFGSFIKGRTFRDIDIAIYPEAGFNLIRFGALRMELTKLTGQEIDLISLNDLPGKNPTLAYEIAMHGHLLFSTDKKMLTNYKRKVLLYYFDTAELRKEVEQAFSKRLESGKFAQRDYV